MAFSISDSCESYDRRLLAEVIKMLHIEIDARMKLELPNDVRMGLVGSAAIEMFAAFEDGIEWVGAAGGLQYDMQTDEWS